MTGHGDAVLRIAIFSVQDSRTVPVYLDLKQAIRTAIAPVPATRRRAVVRH
jgi:hypothetical protein